MIFNSILSLCVLQSVLTKDLIVHILNHFICLNLDWKNYKDYKDYKDKISLQSIQQIF